MRTSRTTWLLVAAIAATTCIHTGCGFSRMGQNVSNMSLPRPRLLSWRKDKPDNDIASARPPRSSIPPSGRDTAGSSSRTLPSEPAPGGRFDYASTSTGGGDYTFTREVGGGYSRTDKADDYGDGYVSRGDSSARSQRGFYNPEYQGDGGSSRSAGSDTRGGYDDYRDTGAAAGGYDSRAGSPSAYGPSYSGGGARDQNYQQVADRRGGYDDSYRGDSGGGYDSGSQYSEGGQYGGGSQYSNADYGAGQSGGGSTYGDTRQVTPGGSGGANYDDYRSPAQGSYDDSYGAGGNYDATYGGSSTQGGASSAGASSRPWRPGSTGRTTPYDQKQLSPPTNSSWGN